MDGYINLSSLSEMMVDMHIHTNASDGTWSPSQLIDEAKKINLGLISITDHDNTKNVKEVQHLASEAGIAVITGVEVSANIDGSLIHILGYGIDVDNDYMKDFLHSFRKIKEGNYNQRDDICIKALINTGYNVDWDEYYTFKYKASSSQESSTRFGVWDFLIHKGLCSDKTDFFRRIYPPLFPNGIPVGVPDFPHPEYTINAIVKASGYPVLAHPYYWCEEADIFKNLYAFKEMGIQGIECFHPKIETVRTQYLKKWCADNSMIITGGSDCHGEFTKRRKLGMLNISSMEISLKDLKNKIVLPTAH